MAILFTCDKCGKSFKVPDELAGKTARCKFCRELSQIPAASESPEAGSPRSHGDTEGRPEDGAAIGSAAVVDASEAAPAPAVVVAETVVSAEAGASAPPRSRRLLTALITLVLMLGVAAGVFFGIKKFFGPKPAEDSAAQSAVATKKGPAAPSVRPHHPAGSSAAQNEICVEHMKRIAAAARAYAEHHQGRFPYDVSNLVDTLPSETFFCPATAKKAPADLNGYKLAEWMARNSDYAWLGGGWGPDRGIPPILMYEKWEGEEDQALHVMDDQFQVRQMPLRELRVMLEEQQRVAYKSRRSE